MPHPTAQTPLDGLVRSYFLRRSTWSDQTLAVATSCLNRWSRWLTAQGITSVVDATGDHCAMYLAERIGAVAGSTAKKDWQHLRWLYAWLVEEGEIDTRRTYGPMSNQKPPKVNDPDPKKIRAISPADYDRLMGSFDKRLRLECRNAAMCSLMYWTGLRRSEVARADLDRLDLANATLELLGKNGQWRTVPLATETVVLIQRYLRRRADDTAPALFASSLHVESDDTGRLRPDAISSMLERRCTQLGIDVTAHQFRRAMSINAKDNGMSDSTICTVAGWADNRMLTRYQRTARERLAVDEFRANDPTAQRVQSRRGRLRRVG